VAPLFGGIPATGAIARTATNVRNGGRTPVAGIVHAFTLLFITLFFGRFAGFIPFAALAAILVIVAWNMSEWRAFRGEFTAPLSDVLVLLSTFALTVIFDLVIAIQVGMVLAAILFMRRMAEVTDVQAVARELVDTGEDRLRSDGTDADIELYDINGPFFFGAAQKFVMRVESLSRQPKVLILRMRNVPSIDSTGLHALRQVVGRNRAQGTLVLLCDVAAQPRAALARSTVLDEIGAEHLLDTADQALAVAREHVTAVALLRP
jgi:sulfate permease, SulP family